MNRSDVLTLGAMPQPGDRCRFRVWAPRASTLDVVIQSPDANSDAPRIERMASSPDGMHEVTLDGIPPGTRYLYRLDGQTDRPDPASRHQPIDVHGPSEVVDPTFDWSKPDFPGIPLPHCVLYEVHIGTFTELGTFDAAIDDLDRIAGLGVTMIEIMPVAAFPGERNWGYDGVLPFAVQNSYGGPAGLQRFVDACHQRGLGVCLDIVYNHLGPEGNYLRDFGPYFTDKYHTPWGEAVNFDEGGCDRVREYFIESALSFVLDYHIDALRLDAVHAIYDQSARPFLHELTDRVHDLAERLSRRVHVIAESDLNDPRLIRPAEIGGFNMDGQWSDDFHHALHALLTGERQGYYEDFGRVSDLTAALSRRFVYDGRFSTFRNRTHGAAVTDRPGRQFVVCSQNHDQVGNRLSGDRLTTLVDADRCRIAAAIVLTAPFVPLLFMGEEYGETAPFLYFVSHSDRELIEAVRTGRRAEFSSFQWGGDPPDPQSDETFSRSRLDRSQRDTEAGRATEAWYAALLRVRRRIAALRALDPDRQIIADDDAAGWFAARRWSATDEALIVTNFSDSPQTARIDAPGGQFEQWLDSSDPRWRGPAAALPEYVDACGVVELSVPPRTFGLYGRRLNDAPATAVDTDTDADSSVRSIH